MKAYYDARAREYDDSYAGAGRFAARDRTGWAEELAALESALRGLPAARTVDVACGTGFLMPASAARWSASTRAGARSPRRGGGSRFYGHLRPDERLRFLAEGRRVARELVVVDSALRDDVEPEKEQERILDDGSRWTVHERYLAPETLLAELGGGRVPHAGRWFVAVAA